MPKVGIIHLSVLHELYDPCNGICSCIARDLGEN